MSHDFEDWFDKNKPQYTKDPIYLSNITYTKQFVKDAWCDGYEEGKSIEWHYVKDKLPTEGEYLVALKYPQGYKETAFLKYEPDSDSDDEKMGWWDSDYENFDEYVYAWADKPKAPKEK